VDMPVDGGARDVHLPRPIQDVEEVECRRVSAKGAERDDGQLRWTSKDDSRDIAKDGRRVFRQVEHAVEGGSKLPDAVKLKGEPYREATVRSREFRPHREIVR